MSLLWLAGSGCGSASDNIKKANGASEAGRPAVMDAAGRESQPDAATSGEITTGESTTRDDAARTEDMDAGTSEPDTKPDAPKEKPPVTSRAGAQAESGMAGTGGHTGGAGRTGAAGMGGAAMAGVGGAAGGGGAKASTRDEPATPVKLGQRLFEDASLSATGTQSCASCHDASRAFTGSADEMRPDFPVARGARSDQLGTRNVPTAMYMQYSPPFAFVKDEEGEWTPTGGQFWDGRANNLAEQAAGPFLNPREMAMPDAAAVVAAVHKADYSWMFEALYGASAWDDVDAAYTHVTEAIAAYEETDAFGPFSSKFDAYLRGQVPLSEQESRGLALFSDETKGNCIACHAGKPESKDPHDWLFTDFTYDNLGVPRNADIPDNKTADSYDLGLCASAVLVGRVPDEITDKDGFIAGFCGAFKVPTLRNVVRTSPYMHNGYFKHLRDVVDFYVTRDTDPGRWYPMSAEGAADKFNDLPVQYKMNVNASEVPYDRKPGDMPRLTPDEIDDVVAFLQTLSDGYHAPPVMP